MSRRALIMICAAGVMSLAPYVVLGGAPRPAPAGPPAATPVAPRAVLEKYCITCHNQRTKTAGLTLDTMDIAAVGEHAEVWENVLLKVSTGIMPPAGRPRPDKAGRDGFISWLEGELDAASVARPNVGRGTLHRLNRTEYTNAIRDLLGLQIDGTSLLPADNAAYGFDNIADALSLSPVLTERYLSAAATVSHLALGHVSGTPSPDTYYVRTDLDQRDRVSEDLPLGSSGGLAVRRYFPADGEYSFKMKLQERGSGRFGPRDDPRQLDVSIDGAKVWTFTGGGPKTAPATDKPPSPSQPAQAVPQPEGEIIPNEAQRRAEPQQNVEDLLQFRVHVTAGSHLVQVYFVPLTSSYVEDLIDPGSRTKYLPGNGAGDPALSSLTITGPYAAAGHDDSPSRRRVLVCRPATKDGTACAEKIISNLGRRAFRRPLTSADLQTLMSLYQSAAARGGFESGIEVALRGILVNPQFLFRLEGQPAAAAVNSTYRITDLELASRLSFFLWSSIPDEELLDVAAKGKLHDLAVLEHQVRRMLADERSNALVKNFAGQWLLVRNMAGVTPNPEYFFQFDDNLRKGFQQETELFIGAIIREDHSVLDLLDADFTFVNERLARHYGIPGVYGERFRRVALPPDSVRRGLLGQGSILTVTSYSHRTSPVLRGKWILDNLLGAPPPPPPPNIPELQDKATDGKVRSAREQMEQHRRNPSCAGCHARMDPLGLALENFDAVGAWRSVDQSEAPIDASGTLPDGGKFDGPVALRKELVTNRSGDFVTTLSQKLLTYALGRGVEYYDAPAVRQIKRSAASTNYRFSSLILGVVKSAPFQMRMARDLGAAPDPAGPAPASMPSPTPKLIN
jgi:mono/diheme cytochrome c family protein